ncbi:MAG: ABC transporter ATP-binding protein [Acidimicrobiales bacterium]
MTTAVLSVRDLWVRYGNVPAVRGVSFDVFPGEVVALLGPNGAGKSSTLSAIMGRLGRQEGTIEFQGDSIVGLSPDKVARRGISLVPEGRHIFGDLTVDENLQLGMVSRGSQVGADEDLAWALELFPVLDDFMGRQAGLLSGGQQQQLAIARALVAQPQLMLLDEPSLGLAPSVIDIVFGALDSIRGRGRTIVIVEQRAARTAAFADRSFVIANGEIRLAINQNDEDTAEAIAAVYFGAEGAGEGRVDR